MRPSSEMLLLRIQQVEEEVAEEAAETVTAEAEAAALPTDHSARGK